MRFGMAPANKGTWVARILLAPFFLAIALLFWWAPTGAWLIMKAGGDKRSLWTFINDGGGSDWRTYD